MKASNKSEKSLPEEVKKLRGKRTAPGQQKIFKIWQLDYGEGASVGWVVDFYIV